MRQNTHKVIVKNSALKVTVSSSSKAIVAKMPIKVVQVNEAGRQGPKGDPGLTLDEVDDRINQKINENRILFRDLAGNIYGSDT